MIRPLLLLSATLGTLPSAEAISPFADKPCESYSGYTDVNGKPGDLRWGKAPLTDFGSRPVTFDLNGVRRLNPAPAPGIHPRICFGPQDLPDVRQRLKATRAGQEAWKNILCWTEMMKGRYDDTAEYAKPDRWNGGFGGLRGRVPLFRLGLKRDGKSPAYNRSPVALATWTALVDGTATEFPTYYWNTMALEAFRCLIEDDAAGAKDCARAVITAMRLDQAARETDRAAKQAKDPSKPLAPPAQPVGGFQLAFAYDFLFNQLDAAQRKALHEELAASTWSHDNYGTFNTAESSRSNWATFSYWLYQVLAIEGEPGFNELKVRGMFRGWRNLMTYGWFQSGATFEGEAKNQLGMDGIILFTMRAQQYGFDNLSGHPYLQAYARSFLPHSANAMLTGFHKYDLLGGSRGGSGGFASTDSLGLKYMFPQDPVIDWYYREAMGEEYGGVPDRPDGYYNGLLFFAIYASDFDSVKREPASLGLGNTFFCGERALMMTRSAWDPNATQLNLHVRQANGGHPFADRNAIMVAGAGRIWSPNGYASFRTFENSVVAIDGLSQSELVPGRLVDFQDQPQATFAVGDAKYCWDWSWQTVARKGGGYLTAQDVRAGAWEVPPGAEPETHTTNDFAFTKLPFDYLNRPLTEAGHWILPSGAVSPVVRSVRTPVVKAFRTAGLVRGAQPYVVVLDDIRMDDAEHRYDWTLALERDVQIARVDRRPDGITDVWLTGDDPDQKSKPDPKGLPALRDPATPIPAGQPVLLVRVLAGLGTDPALEPTIVEAPNAANAQKYAPIRRLVLPVRTVDPGYKVVLIPHRQGEVVPESAWNADRKEATLGKDALRFNMAASGKTDVTIQREGTRLIAVDKPIAPLADPAEDARRARVAALRKELAGFHPDQLPGQVALDLPADAPRALGKVGQALRCTGAKDPVTVAVDLRKVPAFTVAFWFKAEAPVAGTLVSLGNAKGLGLSFDQGKTLRIDAQGVNRWATVPLNFATWHHVVVIVDGTAVRALVDGVEVKAATGPALQLPAQVQVGAGYTGLLDDLRIFTRALTTEEATKFYQTTAFVLPPPK